MHCSKDLTSWDRDDLLALIASLQEHVERLTAVNEGLSKEIAGLKRAGKRQASPFSKGIPIPPTFPQVTSSGRI